MNLRRFGVLLFPFALLLSGCSAKESVRFALAIFTIFAIPVVGAQLVIGGPTLLGSTIARDGVRALAIGLYLLTLVGTVFLAIAATDEIMRLSLASRRELAGDYLLLLVPLTLGASLLGAVCEAAPPSVDIDGTPLPRRRALTILWALVVLAMGAGLGVYVLA